MSSVLETLWEGLANALLMAWQVGWALVLGFVLSAVVQTRVPKERIEHALGGSGPRALALATGLGAASSSCSYAAIAIARSLLAKGASVRSALAFQFASTNLVIELGAVMWVLLGWQFMLAELIGGLVLIAVMAALARAFVSARLERSAREHARVAGEEEGGHAHCHAHAGGADDGDDDGHDSGTRPQAREAFTQVAHSFRHDVSMLWKEILVGFLLAGYIGLLGNGFFDALFIRHAPAPLRLLENVLVGPLVAILSSVCSVGNVPLAAVLWSGGIGFGGVVAFVFADLVVLPIVLIYRKYYGLPFALRITALMLVSIVIAALVVDLLFAGAGLVPHARPSRSQVFEHVHVGFQLYANALAVGVLCALLGVSTRRRRTPGPTSLAQSPT